MTGSLEQEKNANPKQYVRKLSSCRGGQSLSADNFKWQMGQPTSQKLPHTNLSRCNQGTLNLNIRLSACTQEPLGGTLHKSVLQLSSGQSASQAKSW